jgi:hypothetical protein
MHKKHSKKRPIFPLFLAFTLIGLAFLAFSSFSANATLDAPQATPGIFIPFMIRGASSAPPAPSPTPNPTQPPGETSHLPPVDASILGTCSAAIHDRYTVVGPDGATYRTWHPQVVDNGTGGTCRFAHEHGDNPATSLANSSLPAFNYVGLLAGMNEPHEGFKVFVSNKGATNNEGGVAQNSTRTVAHMGTGGPARFGNREHSLQFDLVSSDGHEVHVMGMADTGGSGTICDSPREGKTATSLPGTGCNVTSLYEIWSMEFNVHDARGNKLTVVAAPAVFDPITLLDTANPSTYRLTADFFSGGPFHGCRRENYAGPVYWYNNRGPTTYHTDVMGMIMANGPLTQFISAHDDLGIQMSSTNQEQMKLVSNSCGSGLGVKN